MGVMSKIINTNLRTCTCGEIFHPGATCFEAIKCNLVDSIWTSMKFAGPIALVPFLMKLKRCNKELIKDTLNHFLEFTLVLHLVGNTITTTICLFRNVQGTYSKYTVGFVPAFLAGFWVLIFSNKLYRFLTISVTQIIFDAALRNKKNPLTRAVGGSVWLQTILFMSCSSVVLRAIAKHKYKMFWFVTPPSNGHATNHNGNNVKCKHEDICQNYVLNGIKHYFFLGFALENIKLVLRKLRRVNSFSTYLKSVDWYAIAFLVSYVGIYRLSYCLMNNWTQLDDDVVHPLSAFLGGVSYAFEPNQMLLAYAITLTGEIGWEEVKKRKDTYPNVLQKIINLPYRTVFFPLVLGIVVHHFIFHTWMLNRIAIQFINGATANTGDKCLKNAAEIMWKMQNSK